MAIGRKMSLNATFYVGLPFPKLLRFPLVIIIWNILCPYQQLMCTQAHNSALWPGFQNKLINKMWPESWHLCSYACIDSIFVHLIIERLYHK